MNREIARECLTNGGRLTSEEEIDRFMESWKNGTPVMPVEFVCTALEEWARLASMPVPDPMDNENERRKELGDQARFVFIQIRKSNLLARTIYGGEKPRTERCPHHKGRWSGCRLMEETECKGACGSDLNVTGWLK